MFQATEEMDWIERKNKKPHEIECNNGKSDGPQENSNPMGEIH